LARPPQNLVAGGDDLVDEPSELACTAIKLTRGRRTAIWREESEGVMFPSAYEHRGPTCIANVFTAL
jgi:hypothetical protein